MTTKLGVLISGRGSNMQAIVAACRRGDVPAKVALVVSNRASAAGIAWAREHGLATAVLPHRDFPSREAHDLAVVAALREAGVEWVCLAGYMRLLSPAFVESFPERILNIHPSLLPAFPGLEAQRQAWEYGVKVSGCTVHLVDAELDHGPIVVQRTVPVLDTDDPDTLAARILEQEHQAYPEALRRLLTRPWSLAGRRVAFADETGRAVTHPEGGGG
jgi:phosphoribosylglycinamide formyltransferase-1